MKREKSVHMDSLFLKKQLLRELEESSRFTELNIEFMEQNTYLANWLMNYCVENHIEPPNVEKLQYLIQKTREIIQKMNEPYARSDENLQGEKNDENRRRLDSTIGAKT